MDNATGRPCPYCKEDIKADAIKCKHCWSAVAPDKPAHAGICPFCKEDIKPDAIRCKHCKADLRPGGDFRRALVRADAQGKDCGCASESSNVHVARMLRPRPHVWLSPNQHRLGPWESPNTCTCLSGHWEYSFSIGSTVFDVWVCDAWDCPNPA
jgi:hypothetical protein